MKSVIGILTLLFTPLFFLGMVYRVAEVSFLAGRETTDQVVEEE